MQCCYVRPIDGGAFWVTYLIEATAWFPKGILHTVFREVTFNQTKVYAHQFWYRSADSKDDHRIYVELHNNKFYYTSEPVPDDNDVWSRHGWNVNPKVEVIMCQQ